MSQPIVSRRACVQALAAAAAGAAWPVRAQADWPSRPLRIVTAAGAGDPNDLSMRRFVPAVGAELNNTTFIVDNKPGAGGMLAHQQLLLAPADGYTVLQGNASLTILPGIQRKLTYHPQTDFAPVAFMGWSAIGLAIPASRPEKTFPEWLAWARKQGGKLNYGSAGGGSIGHLYGFQLGDQFDLEATHIPQRGLAPVVRDLVAQEIHYTLADIFSLRSFLAPGQLRLLAVAGTERSRFLPEVPTFKELGVAGFERMGWNAWFVRAGTPAAIVERLAGAVNRVNAKPDWVAFREQFWLDHKPLTPSEIGAQVRRETEAWGLVARKSGYVAE